MKRIVLVLVIFSVLSCTKEQVPPTIVGTWTLTEINSGNTSSIQLFGNEVSVEFKKEGNFEILGPKSNYTFLQDFDKYELVNMDRIRFFNTASSNELFAFFQVSNTLSFAYEIRCPYEEKFMRR